MVRLALLLVIGGGLIIFAVQNFTPVPLVILGVPTPPLPLSLWVLGAIAAGTITTLVTATLFNVTVFSSAPRPRQSPQKRPTANRFPSGAAATGGASWQPETPKNPSSSSRQSTTRYADDWESPQPSEDWEDWSGYREPVPPPVTSQAPPPPDRRGSYERESIVDDYQPYEPPRVEEPEVWDDWEEDAYPGDRPSTRPTAAEPDLPRRTDFEVRQEPKTRYQSGSIYSYSYRQEREATRPDSVSGETVSGETVSGETVSGETVSGETVYDAEYRVITPPYRPDSEVRPLEEEDWGNEERDHPAAGDRPPTPSP